MAQGEDLDEERAIWIESTTAMYSADIYITERKGASVSGEVKKENQKRTSVGIGEIVFLTVKGKQYYLEDATMEWEVTEGAALGVLSRRGETGAMFTFHAHGSKEGTVTIKATSSKGAECNYTLSVILPSGLTAQLAKKSEDAEDYISPPIKKLCEQCAACTECKGEKKCNTCKSCEKKDCIRIDLAEDNTYIGVSAELNVIASPTNVNFSKASMIEVDAGTEPASGLSHTPGPATRFSMENGFTDHIAYVTNKSQENSWTWNCHFYTYGNQQKIHLIDKIKQIFQVSRDGSGFSVTITKFGVSVSRSTAK